MVIMDDRPFTTVCAPRTAEGNYGCDVTGKSPCTRCPNRRRAGSKVKCHRTRQTIQQHRILREANQEKQYHEVNLQTSAQPVSQPQPGAYQQPGAYRHPVLSTYQQPIPAAYQQPVPLGYQQPAPIIYQQMVPTGYPSPIPPSGYQQPLPGNLQYTASVYQQHAPSVYQPPVPPSYQQLIASGSWRHIPTSYQHPLSLGYHQYNTYGYQHYTPVPASTLGHGPLFAPSPSVPQSYPQPAVVTYAPVPSTPQPGATGWFRTPVQGRKRRQFAEEVSGARKRMREQWRLKPLQGYADRKTELYEVKTETDMQQGGTTSASIQDSMQLKDHNQHSQHPYVTLLQNSWRVRSRSGLPDVDSGTPDAGHHQRLELQPEPELELELDEVSTRKILKIKVEQV